VNKEAKEIITKWESNDFDGFSVQTVEQYQKFEAAKIGKEEKAQLELDAKIKELAKNETSLLRDAKEKLVKWEARDPQTYLLWSTMNGWVYDGFKSTYEAMGVNFDRLYYESETYLLGKDLVSEGLSKGVFYKKEDGSLITYKSEMDSIWLGNIGPNNLQIFSNRGIANVYSALRIRIWVIKQT
jgi:arginyl-tRNA synthetase